MRKGYGQFCPVAKGAEVFAERWTPLVLREMVCGSTTFNDLKRGVPLMSRSLLSTRLKDLQRAGVIERREDTKGKPTYHLTEAGQELQPVIEMLGRWGVRWAQSHLTAEDMDPQLLMWDIRRNIHKDRLPTERVVMNFVFPDVDAKGPRRIWLVLGRDGVDVCYKDPGYDIDLVITAEVKTLVHVWLGEIPWSKAVDSGRITVDGPARLATQIPDWLMLSGFAAVDRPT